MKKSKIYNKNVEGVEHVQCIPVNKMRVRFYYDNKPSLGEKVSNLTKTVPDLSYSIQEIIDRFSRNNLVDMEYHEPVYGNDDFDDVDLEKVRDSDLTDRWLKYQELDELRKEQINLSRQNAKLKQQELVNLANNQSGEANSGEILKNE